MTKLNVTLALDDTCKFTVTDVTGFYNSVSNVGGFLPESDSNPAVLNVYKLSQGYFLNVLLYNKYAVPPQIVGTGDTPFKVATPISTTYANNFVPSVYNLIIDGTYTLKRFFIPSQQFFTATVGSGIWNAVAQYYTNGDVIYKMVSGQPVPTTLTTLLTADSTNSNVLQSSTNFISTCYTNACYFKLLNRLVDLEVTNCDLPKQLIQERDLLYMTLEVIQYLKEKGNLTQIQKLIEVVNICGGICAKTLKATSATNCGCSG